ncbi:Heat stress transcription factor A-1d [Linum perenne]
MDGATKGGGGGGSPDATTSGGGGGGAPPTPVPMSSQSNAPPPFLSKTYDMVEDPSCDAIVSWSPTNNSFVVWNPPEFARDLLPKYFKHNNFSSFVRQLNTYGFRKVDPDRWEFANEGFLRGQKHLLKGITRRKPAHGHSQQQAQPSSQVQKTSSVGAACVEVGKFGLEEEVERLKRDKNVLMQELVRLRQQQQATDGQLQTMVQRLQGMEQRQQQMMSFLAKAMQSPGFLAQFVQQQNENSRRISSETNKKRRLKQDGVNNENESSSGGVPDGQIVKYQPLMNDAAKAMLRQIMKLDGSSRSESYNNIFDGFSSPNAIDGGNRVSGVTLQEVPPTSGQQPDHLSGHSSHGTAPDVMMPELHQIPEMVPELPGDNSMEPDTGDDCFPPSSSSINSSIPLDIGNIPTDPDENFDALLDIDHDFWDGLLVQSPLPDNIQSSPDNNNNGPQPMEKEWEKTEHMNQLTQQMGLLSPEAKKLL